MTKKEPEYPAAEKSAALPAARRDYRDTIFRMLFRDRKNLLSLYNALNQTSYQNPEADALFLPAHPDSRTAVYRVLQRQRDERGTLHSAPV